MPTEIPNNEIVDSKNKVSNGATEQTFKNAELTKMDEPTRDTGKPCATSNEIPCQNRLQRLFLDGKRSNPFEWGMRPFELSDERFGSLNEIHALCFSPDRPEPNEFVIVAPKANSADEYDLLYALQIVFGWSELFTSAPSLPQAEFRDRLVALLANAPARGVGFVYQYHLHAIELPLSTYVQIPDIENSKNLAQSAADRLVETISEILDADGWPNAKYLFGFEKIIATWARCVQIINDTGLEFPEETLGLLAKMVRNVIRMSRPDGTLMLCGRDSAFIKGAFRKAFLNLSTESLDPHLASICFSKPKLKPAAEILPEESACSERAELAVMQTSWKNSKPKLAVNFSGGQNVVEICNKARLIDGDATPEISLNGKVLAYLDRGFQLVCWHQDDEVDYLELEIDLEDNVVLQRQYFLGREDEILLIADVIVPKSPGRIDYRCTMPFAKGAEAMAESETREIYLKGTKGSKIRSLVIPLGLSEWKDSISDNAFLMTNAGLELRQSIDGAGLCAAWFFDLKQKRSVKPRTWRQLTVGEQLEIVGRDQSVAYRIQVGKEQWIVYRAVATNGNRTFMGQNFAEDFFVGRFDRHGEVEELLQIAK